MATSLPAGQLHSRLLPQVACQVRAEATHQGPQPGHYLTELHHADATDSMESAGKAISSSRAAESAPEAQQDVLVHRVFLGVIAGHVTNGQCCEPEDGDGKYETEDEKDEPPHTLTHLVEAPHIGHQLQHEEEDLLERKGAVNVMYYREAQKGIKHTPPIAEQH